MYRIKINSFQDHQNMAKKFFRTNISRNERLQNLNISTRPPPLHSYQKSKSKNPPPIKRFTKVPRSPKLSLPPLPAWLSGPTLAPPMPSPILPYKSLPVMDSPLSPASTCATNFSTDGMLFFSSAYNNLSM